MNRQFAGWVTHHWTKWIVLVVALLLLGGFGSLASKLTGVQNNEQSAWLPGDSESTQVIEESRAFTDPEAQAAVVLYERASGITPADIAKATADARAIKQLPFVRGDVVGPIPSKDGRALQLVASIAMGQEGWEIMPDRMAQVDAIATKASNGLGVHLAGPAAVVADNADAFAGVDGILLFSAVGVVIIILLLTYRSPILVLIPLLAAGVSLGIAQGVVYLMAKDGLTVNGQSAAILTVLVFGAGTDYALLLIARYREELHRFEDRHEAMSHALHRAGPAILASGATVIIGLLCLTFAQMNSTSGLGPVTTVGIIVALAAMLTLLPALLVIVGRWVFWPLIPRYGDAERIDRGLWARVGQQIARRPRFTWVGTTVILAFFAFGTVQLDANGLSNEEGFVKNDTPSITAEKLAAKHYPDAAGNPVVMLADSEATDEVRQVVNNTQGIVPSSVEVKGQKDGRVYLEATLAAAPDSSAAFDTVDRVRDNVHAISGADAKVGGITAVNHDIQSASGEDNRLIIPIILMAVFLILAMLLRAFVAPLILLATVVLSFGAALGISAFVFRNVFDFAGADSSLPLLSFVFLVALGIDYNIFLMTRVREEALKHGTRRGALIGLGATGGVITSAGLVLAGTFSALATLPLVFIAELGFTVAVGVLLDTIIVRSVLVTALNLDIGRHIWWPSELAQRPDEAAPDIETRTSEPARV